jgi:hypothetical protein
MVCRGASRSHASLGSFAKHSHFLSEAFPRDPGYVNVYGYVRRNVASSASGSLEALEFVQAFVKASLYHGLIAGELREGVRFVGVPDGGSDERGALASCLAFSSPRLGFGECFLMLLFVRYGVNGVRHVEV